MVQRFDSYGVLWLPGPLGDFHSFGHWSPTETIQLTTLARTVELYEEAVTADAATNFTATPRLFWTDSPDDMQRLNADWAQAAAQILEARTSTVTINQLTYRGHTL